MKFILTTAFLLILGMGGYAQENAITKHFSAQLQDDEYTKVSVTSKMFSLFTELDTDLEEEQDVLDAIAKLEGIKGIFKDDLKGSTTLYKEAVAKIDSDGSYEELMTVENVNENAKFLIKDENGKISELLMVMGGRNEFVAMSLFGDIDLSAIAKIAKVMRIRGFEHFGQLGGK